MNQSRSRIRRVLFAATALTMLLGVLAPVPPQAAGPGSAVTPPPAEQSRIQVPLNKSRVLDLRNAAARVSVANPAIADILVINPSQIYVVGKELGTTNMVLWNGADQIISTLGLEVVHDIQSLKEKMFQLLPGERIKVESAQGAIILSGEVSSAPKMAAALKIAEQYASSADGQARVGLPGGGQANVINLMQVGGAQQVVLEVKVAEINRVLSKRFDIDFTGIYDGGSVRMGLVKGGATIPFAMGPGGLDSASLPGAYPTAGAIATTGGFANVLSGNFFFNVVLDIARAEGLAKILAEPNLTTLSGQEAQFLSGGEFPVPVADDDGNTTIEYKDFGIKLIFIPVVLDSGLISLKVTVSVSELSNATYVALNPSQTSSLQLVPSLRTRGANATVEVPSGQTLAIAGLLSENLKEASENVPGLANVPLLGALFRGQQYEKNQNELVIFVTPRLARPFQTELARLPTDNFIEPSDTEFYLMGRLEGRRPGEDPAVGKSVLGPDKTGTEGYFGHDL